MLRIVSDLRRVFRQLLKSPGFAITVVLMLALGIGATTTVFSVVDGVLLRPLPFPHAEQVVTLGDQVSGTEWGKQDEGPVTGPEVVTYSRDTHAFAAIGGYQTSSYELSGIGDPAQVDGARMTPGVFSSLEIKPLMGRVFTPEEDVQKDSVVVLSYATWMSRFSGDPHILGRKILLDRKPYQVIGVMPANFEFPITLGHTDRCELWVPMSFSPQDVSSEAKGNWSYLMVGRLKDGVSLSQAQGDAERVAQQIMREFPPDLASFHIRPVVYDLRQIAVLQVRPLLQMLFMVVVVVLLIACANLAGLLLVRAVRRQRESAVRLALGATVARLLWQEMLEGLVLCGLGGALGIGLAAIVLSLGKTILPANIPRIDDITLDWKVVGFGLCLGIVTGILCGLAPAFAALGTNVNVSLKKGGRGNSASASHIRLRSVLVVFEIAIALVLLTTSGLFLESFDEMSRVGFGFNPEYVTTASYSLPREEYGAQTRVDSFDEQLLQKLRQTPAVQFAGLSNVLPASGKGRRESIVVDGSADGESAAVPSLVIGDYFRALEIPLLRGRLLAGADNANSQLVVVVNHEFAEHFWPHQDPIGKRMRVGTQKVNTPWMTVVGEVADARLFSRDADAKEQFYQPAAQLEKSIGPYASPRDLIGNEGYIVLRSSIPPGQMENSLRASVRSLDPELPLSNMQSMENVVSSIEAPRRFNTIIVSSFALAAIVLAFVGIYSVIAFSVAARVQEMAIRVALGSQPSGIMRLILLSGIKLAATGTVIGVAGAAVASNLLRSFLFRVRPFDPLIMILAAVVILSLALIASVLPARRAASIHPMEALRGD